MTSKVGKHISDLLVNELKLELEHRGLDKTGIKATLIERLTQAVKNEGHEIDNYEFYATTSNAESDKPASKNDNDAEDVVAENPEANSNDTSLLKDSTLTKPKEEKIESNGEANTSTEVKETSPTSGNDAQPETTLEKSELLNDTSVASSNSSLPTSPAENPPTSTTETTKSQEDEATNLQENQSPQDDNSMEVDKEENEKKAYVNISRESRGFWVSNIGKTTTAADLKMFVMQYAPVVSAKIFMSKQEGNPDCYGYVTMANVESAQIAQSKLDHTLFKGRIISIGKTTGGAKRPAIQPPAASIFTGASTKNEKVDESTELSTPPSPKKSKAEEESNTNVEIVESKAPETVETKSAESPGSDIVSLKTEESNSKVKKTEPKVPIKAPEPSPRHRSESQQQETSAKPRIQSKASDSQKHAKSNSSARSSSANVRRRGNATITYRDPKSTSDRSIRPPPRRSDDSRPSRRYETSNSNYRGGRSFKSEAPMPRDSLMNVDAGYPRKSDVYYNKEQVMSLMAQRELAYEREQVENEKRHQMMKFRLKEAELERERLAIEKEKAELKLQAERLRKQQSGYSSSTSNLRSTSHLSSHKSSSTTSRPFNSHHSSSSNAYKSAVDSRGEASSRRGREPHRTRSRSPQSIRPTVGGRAKTQEPSPYPDLYARKKASTNRISSTTSRRPADNSDYYANRSTSSQHRSTSGTGASAQSYPGNYARNTSSYSTAYDYVPPVEQSRSDKRLNSSNQSSQNGARNDSYRSAASYPLVDDAYGNRNSQYSYKPEAETTGYAGSRRADPYGASLNYGRSTESSTATYNRMPISNNSSLNYEPVVASQSSYSTASPNLTTQQGAWNSANYSYGRDANLSGGWARNHSGWNSDQSTLRDSVGKHSTYSMRR
ncbi:Scaffold attachment factor B2 [Aphelenchoides besseyi]|nr:Scaffold attachment factor B2 [Aphelenchoides besseyi]KAI6225725.1 Scaffold attachment factor B2 [Aphelenchoides besseyi]